MQGKSGIWIDHKEAFVVFAEAPPDAEKHVRFAEHKSSSHTGGAEDQRDRQHSAHLGKFYDEVISHVRDAESIFIFGPGEAKGELGKRLAEKGLGERVVGMETVDKMTNHQIAAKVRAHYQV